MKLKHLFFDWSGTLLNDFQLSFLSTQYIIRRYSKKEISLEDYRNDFQIPVDGFYNKYFKSPNIKKVDEDYFTHFEKISKKAKLYPKVKNILDLANRNKIKLYLVSTVRQDLLEDLVVQHKLQKYFHGHVYGGVFNKEKFLPRFCKLNKIDVSHSIFVGDLSHDIVAGRKAGMKSAAMLYGYGSKEKLYDVNPDFIFSHDEEFLNFLKVITKKEKKDKKISKKDFPIATVGALIRKNNEIFLIQTHKWNHCFGIPGGKIEYNESIINAVKREVLEETGLKLYQIDFFLVQDSIHSKEFYRKGKHFILMNFIAKARSKKYILNDEAYSGIWINPKAALKLNLNQPTRYLIEKFLENYHEQF